MTVTQIEVLAKALTEAVVALTDALAIDLAITDPRKSRELRLTIKRIFEDATR